MNHTVRLFFSASPPSPSEPQAVTPSAMIMTAAPATAPCLRFTPPSSGLPPNAPTRRPAARGRPAIAPAATPGGKRYDDGRAPLLRWPSALRGLAGRDRPLPENRGRGL
ncbi:hypothetical protein GCM10027168_67500 [Streptomyces capparidis]